VEVSSFTLGRQPTFLSSFRSGLVLSRRSCI
jgi:hypothetical protein